MATRFPSPAYRRLGKVSGLLAIAIAGGAAAEPRPASRVFIASDSTAQDYPADRYPQAGWGTMLRCAFASDIIVENRAIGGRSTRSFMAEGRLDAIQHDIHRGDTLLIQFGHNDANQGKPERYTPVPEYEMRLKQFISVARAAKAQPVILTPVTRRSFDGSHVVPSFPAYAAAAKRVAAQTHTPVIDLATLSEHWIESVGPEASRTYYLHYTPETGLPGFPKGIDDDTHFSELGARHVADLIAGALARTRLPIARHVLSKRPALERTTPAGSASCA